MMLSLKNHMQDVTSLFSVCRSAHFHILFARVFPNLFAPLSQFIIDSWKVILLGASMFGQHISTFLTLKCLCAALHRLAIIFLFMTFPWWLGYIPVAHHFFPNDVFFSLDSRPAVGRFCCSWTNSCALKLQCRVNWCAKTWPLYMSSNKHEHYPLVN